MTPLIARLRNRLGQLRWNSLAIIAGSLLVVLLSDGFVAHVLWTNYDEAVHNAESENSDLAHVLEKYLLTEVQGVDLLITSTVRALEANPSLREHPPRRLLELLQARVAAFPNVNEDLWCGEYAPKLALTA